MSCNTEVNIQILAPDQVIRLQSRFIGVDPKRMIILELGDDYHWQKAQNFLFIGQEIIVRIIRSNEPKANVLAFKSKIQKVEKNLGYWLLIDYPKELQKVALRHQSRIPISLSSVIVPEKGETEKSQKVKPLALGALKDISIKGGAFVSSGLNTIMCEESYLLKVELSTELDTQLVPITIKNILPIEHDDEAFQYGFTINCSQVKAESIVHKLLMCHLLK
nr:flagellar brake domain-containing protein [Shewanella nanhaiensis]